MGVSAGDILKTTVNFALQDGSLCQNVFHHTRTGVGILNNAAHVAAVKLWAETMYNTIIDEVKATVLEQLSSVDKVEWIDGEWQVSENIGTFVPVFYPNGTAEQLPSQSSAFAVGKTARPKTVGRKFLPPFTEDCQAGTYLTTAALAAVVAWTDYYINDIVIVALNNLVSGVPRTAVEAWYPFTLGLVTDLLGSQRRRRPGVGL